MNCDSTFPARSRSCTSTPGSGVSFRSMNPFPFVSWTTEPLIVAVVGGVTSRSRKLTLPVLNPEMTVADRTVGVSATRSEERRGGKECGARGWLLQVNALVEGYDALAMGASRWVDKTPATV